MNEGPRTTHKSPTSFVSTQELSPKAWLPRPLIESPEHDDKDSQPANRPLLLVEYRCWPLPPRAQECATLALVTMPALLERLPSPDALRELSVAVAVLDVAMSPEDEPDDRCFRFDPRDPSGVAMASMDNGSGDRYFIAFTEDAVFGWGFAHESPMNPFTLTPVAVWPGLLDGLPARFDPLTRDARFQIA